MADQNRKICIVLDTNIWRSSHGLRSPIATSLVHAAFQLKAKIGLPEVEERELGIQWRALAQETLEGMEKLGRILVEMMGEEDGNDPTYLLPMESLNEAWLARLKELEPLIERVPLTLEHTYRSLDRIDNHLAPSGKENEQFRDCAIWEAVLELAAKYDIHFISNDGRFFEAKNSIKLAPNLAEDCKRAAGTLSCYRTIEACLEVITPSVPQLPESELVQAVIAAIGEVLRAQVAKAQFTLGGLEAWSVKSYPTGKSKMTVTYSLAFALTSPATDRRNAKLNVTGDCRFDLTTRAASDTMIDSEEITWRDDEGKTHRAVPRSPYYSFMSGDNVIDSIGKTLQGEAWTTTVTNVYGNMGVTQISHRDLKPDSVMLGDSWEEIELR
jgi:PIN domain